MTRILLFISIITFASCSAYRNYYGATCYDLTEDLTKVRRLDLTDGKTISIEDVGRLYDLRRLDISGNTEVELEQIFEGLPSPEKLEVLLLDSLDLKNLPPSLFRFTHLEHISLAGNPSLDFDASFERLAELPLEFLNLSNNDLQVLPASITKIKSLQDVNLSYNHLAEGSSYVHLGELPSLLSLWIDHNNLEHLPEEIGALKNVVYLHINNNKLSSIPSSIRNLRKTRTVHAGYNAFTEMPPELTTMKSLILLHMNNCAIEYIPEEYLENRYPLAGLILDNNPLPESEKEKARKTFKGFFVLSLQQKIYK